MSWLVPAADLMIGPRGRYLCWSILSSAMSDSVESGAWDRIWEAAHAGDLSDRIGDLDATVARADPGALADATDELVLMPALADTAATAMYWQQPDPVEWALTHPGVRHALMPIARAVAESPAARWWPESAALDTQQFVDWEGADGARPRLSGVDQELADWRTATLEDERLAAERPSDPAANWSGYWWSAPALSRLPATTRAISGLGAVGLALVEDPHNWSSASCQPVNVRPGVRVYEINGPKDWAQLAARYPLDVTRSRRHDWYRVTGWTGTWLTPDYTAVAADYDAIHVTALGYLTTAGRDLPVGEARTILAGWNPDATYWLTDSIALAGPAIRLERREGNPVKWVPVA